MIPPKPGTRLAIWKGKDTAMVHVFSVLGPILILVGMVGSVMELSNTRRSHRRF
jgi:ribosomal protein S28E/S33